MKNYQVTTERLGLNYKSCTMVVYGFIVFAILLVATMMHQASTFSLFKDSAKGEVLLEDKAQNVTVNILGGTTRNDTAKPLGGTAENSTTPCTGSENEGFTSSNSDSFQHTSDPTDKPYDGLLAPRFDERSCFSRYQSYLYRKPSPHKPSQYLISKLHAYEDLHRRCGPHTKAYNKTIRKLVKTSHINNGATPCNYVFWTRANGLGNRIVNIVSTFLYAVLTNRVLLVEFDTEMVDLFCEPFPNSSWLMPGDFPHWNQRKHLETYESLLKKSNRENTSRELSPSFLYLDLVHRDNDYDNQFHCDYNQDLLQKVPALIMKSDQYFVPSLFMTPSFKQELSRMFPGNKEAVFYHLGHYLLHPSNEVWGLITRFYRTYLAKADERIGLQIRVFNSKNVPHQTVMDQILACTLKHKILPEVDKRTLVASPSKNQSSKAVLVASLYSNYTEQLRNMYWTKPTANGETVGVYQPSHEEYQKFYDHSHTMKAWAEIYLLSLCDVLVTSSQSTFGYVAQALGGLKPRILDKQLDERTPDPPCQQALSMEPCFHFPPKNGCKGKTKLDNVTSLFPYMRSCEDLNTGVKLVSDED